MERPKHLIRPDQARAVLASMSQSERERTCRQQVDRWREVALNRPTPRSRDAHAFWLETSALFGEVGVAAALGEIMFDDSAPLTPRQARRLVG